LGGGDIVYVYLLSWRHDLIFSTEKYSIVERDVITCMIFNYVY